VTGLGYSTRKPLRLPCRHSYLILTPNKEPPG
jgi:hypothetical protein